MALSAEALRTKALEGAWYVEALGVDATSVGPSALIDIYTLLIRWARVAERTCTLEAAVGVDALSVQTTR